MARNRSSVLLARIHKWDAISLGQKGDKMRARVLKCIAVVIARTILLLPVRASNWVEDLICGITIELYGE